MKPPIKWAGGKTQILSKILFPKTVNDYHEPFLGGGSVLLHFLESVENGDVELQGKVFAYDINPSIIGMYNSIKSKPKEFISKTQKIVMDSKNSGNEKQFYYETRTLFNGMKDKQSIEAVSLFIFLNKTCFRGLYREGPNGFNVPYGHYKNPEVINEESIYKLSDLIQAVTFKVSSWEETLSPNFKKNDFVYLDPPYVPITQTSFVNYTCSGFSEHGSFFGLVFNIEGRFTLSNSDTPLVREYFSPLTIETVNCKRSINSKNPESVVNEVIVTNW